MKELRRFGLILIGVGQLVLAIREDNPVALAIRILVVSCAAYILLRMSRGTNQ